MGVNLGDEVGYTIRFEDHTTSVRLFLSHSCAFFFVNLWFDDAGQTVSLCYNRV